MSEFGWRGYQVKTEMPIRYENLLNKKDDPGGFIKATKHIEYYIRKTGDEIKHASNVKASMTEWRTHQKNDYFWKIANAALYRIIIFLLFGVFVTMSRCLKIHLRYSLKMLCTQKIKTL